jgi:hypothetical protein
VLWTEKNPRQLLRYRASSFATPRFDHYLQRTHHFRDIEALMHKKAIVFMKKKLNYQVSG